MALSAGQIQALLILEIGDTAGGVLAAQMATIWDSYADYASVSPRLQELYSKRRGIDLVLGSLREASVDYQTESGLLQKLHQKIDTLEAMRERAQDEIDAVEKRALGARTPAAGALTTTTPVTPPTGPLTGPLDASWPNYSGSPYWPRRNRT